MEPSDLLSEVFNGTKTIDEWIKLFLNKPITEKQTEAINKLFKNELESSDPKRKSVALTYAGILLCTGCVKSENQPTSYFEQAIKLDDQNAVAKYYLATMYVSGLGVQKDTKELKSSIQRAVI